MTASPPTAPGGRALAWATLGAIIATLAVNSLSNIVPPGGQNVGEIANTILAGVLITPANYAFIIWGLIYLGLLSYGLYQLGPARQQPTIQIINKLLIGACLAQVVWIFLFTLQFFWLSVLVMLGILLPLVAIYVQLWPTKASRSWRWRVQRPFSLYLGWIAVATVVNVASALYAAGWGGWGLSDVAWTVVMMAVAAAIAAVLLWQRGDGVLALVFVWALGAIAQRHADIPALAWTAVGLALGLVAELAYVRLRPRS